MCSRTIVETSSCERHRYYNISKEMLLNTLVVAVLCVEYYKTNGFSSMLFGTVVSILDCSTAFKLMLLQPLALHYNISASNSARTIGVSNIVLGNVVKPMGLQQSQN